MLKFGDAKAMSAQEAQKLREGVRKAYSDAAEKSQAEHPFPVGRTFAESLGYPKALLDALPEACVEAFAGVSCVAVSADIPLGATVLDLGCGAGLDALISARRVGPEGRVIGVDFSDAMIGRAREAALAAGCDNAIFHVANAENLPVEEGAIDVGLVNGIFNLNPKRKEIFQELARVVRTGGMVFAAELILREPLPQEEQGEADWFA